MIKSYLFIRYKNYMFNHNSTPIKLFKDKFISNQFYFLSSKLRYLVSLKLMDKQTIMNYVQEYQTSLNTIFDTLESYYQKHLQKNYKNDSNLIVDELINNILENNLLLFTHFLINIEQFQTIFIQSLKIIIDYRIKFPKIKKHCYIIHELIKTL